MGLWNFVQDQLLGMAWLNDLIGRGLDKVGVDTASPMGGSLHFFLYDVIKITVLLCVLIFLVSYLQSYFPPERSRKILGRFRGMGANLVAAAFRAEMAPSAMLSLLHCLASTSFVMLV